MPKGAFAPFGINGDVPPIAAPVAAGKSKGDLVAKVQGASL